jgi:hypothetical protein
MAKPGDKFSRWYVWHDLPNDRIAQLLVGASMMQRNHRPPRLPYQRSAKFRYWMVRRRLIIELERRGCSIPEELKREHLAYPFDGLNYFRWFRVLTGVVDDASGSLRYAGAAKNAD